MKRSSWLPLFFLTVSIFCGAKVDKKQVRSTVKSELIDTKNLVVIDTIEVTIYGEEGTDIITKSDLDRPSIDGVHRSKEDRILESLLYAEAKKFKMLPTPEAVEKHLQAVQVENGLSKDELYNIFRAAGYTPEEGKEQFGRLSAIGSIMDFKIRSRLIVPNDLIELYYKEHPVWEEPTYQLQRAVVRIPRDRDSKLFKKELQHCLRTGIGPITIEWSEPFWIDQRDIAAERQFILSMKEGHIKIIEESSGGFELLKMVTKKEKRLKPLDERYREIADILRRPKYEELLTQYKQSLWDASSIVYF